MDKVAEQVKTAEVNGFTGALIDAGFLKVANDEEAAAVAEIIAEQLPEDYTLEDAMAIAAEIIAILEEEEGGGEAAVPAEDVGEDDMVVEASEKPQYTESQVMAAYGELNMAKEAGDISDEVFEKEAASLQGLLQSIKGAGKAAYKGDIGAGAKGLASNAGSGARSFGRKLVGKDYRGSAAASREAKATGSSAMNKLKSQGVDTSGAMANRAAKPLYDAKEAIKYTGSNRKKELMKMLGAQTATAGAAGGAGYGAKSLLDKYQSE